ncbi:hypothetical protein PVAP13_9NG283300 [Panicum virgatum]|uniref:F-box associated beta-propeller type 3 domain-containing protein n=1 Tax=Panicum virgatum TaxID=38727 RepID=A0A8T0MCJ4_PANVG|nr:hypothetical protein PVAP13_9NG283300 [Panicum virgatum]
MAKKKAREEDEIEEAALPSEAATRKMMRTGGASTASPGMCDDVVRSIFARVPARTAVASMALSSHHRRLMLCRDFIALHCRLGPPLPRPCIAYIATAKQRPGARGRRAPVPLFVNACNGVVLLAGRPRRSTCVLWNPTVAGEEKEVTVPVPARDDCAILGLGYGPRSKTYKLLLTCREKIPKELLVYALGGAGEQPRLRTLLLPEGMKNVDGTIIGESLYMDGKIYLLHLDKSVILAFDVDDETVASIDLPGLADAVSVSPLMAVSGRPCVDTEDRHGRALWLLTAEHQWQRIYDHGRSTHLYLRMSPREDGMHEKLFLYCTDTKKLRELNLPRSLTPECPSDYALCWGYKPTLVSPASVVGELNQDEGRRRHRTADIMALKPVNERDRRKGHKETLDTVCFMEFLVRIMQKLPENVEDVIGMPLLKSKHSDYSFKNIVYDSDSGSGFSSCV